MSRYPVNKKLLLARIITIFVLIFVLILLLVFSGYPKLVERYYSEGLYPVICKILHPVFNLFPFSIGDIGYIVITGYLIYAVVKIVRLLFRKEFKQIGIYLSGIIVGWLSLTIAFYFFWGLNYFRPSAGERLNLRDTSYTTEHLQTVTHRLIDSANICRSRLTIADLTQHNDSIYQTALSAIKKLSADSADFRTYSPGIKPSILTPLMNYLGTSGYYNPFTTESQLNYQMPYFTRPVVACHELSHQMGYGPEDEADFVGYLAGIGSKDRLLRYSAYQMAIEQCMHALRYRDTAASNQMRKFISPVVIGDFKTQHQYWLKYRGPVEIISSVFYNNYLKANNQPHGLETYNQMVLLLMAWYR